VVEQYQTEEEQIEALKKWWNENSRSTFLAIAVVIGGSFGWQGWQDHSREQAEMASSMFDDMLQAASPANGGQPTPEQLTSARYLASQLKSDYASSSYAQFAALHLAKLAVTENDLDTAASELRWVLSQSPEQDVLLVTQLRLARVLAAQDDLEAALKMLQVDNAGEFDPSFAEAEGDIQLSMGNTAAARLAYERALMQSGQQAGMETVALKLQSLNPVPARDAQAFQAAPVIETELENPQLPEAGE
jgi:predicted negative regulator of RcsB-dependent stress response